MSDWATQQEDQYIAQQEEQYIDMWETAAWKGYSHLLGKIPNEEVAKIMDRLQKEHGELLESKSARIEAAAIARTEKERKSADRGEKIRAYNTKRRGEGARSKQIIAEVKEKFGVGRTAYYDHLKPRK